MLSGEATNTNSIVFGLTRGEHANHYTTDIVAHLGFIYPHKAKLNVQLWLTSFERPLLQTFSGFRQEGL
jgi:hypothetical protein